MAERGAKTGAVDSVLCADLFHAPAGTVAGDRIHLHAVLTLLQPEGGKIENLYTKMRVVYRDRAYFIRRRLLYGG